MSDKIKISLLAVALFVLNGCSDVQETLGLTKSSPDEFAVVKRAPLEMPPGEEAGSALPPPRPGAARPQEKAAVQRAQEAVLGISETAEEGSTSSASEIILLQKAGALKADPDIRRTVDHETSVLKDRNKPVAQKLLGIGGDRNEISASVVNAKEEAARIRQNIEEGKPITEGETPSIEE